MGLGYTCPGREAASLIFEGRSDDGSLFLRVRMRGDVKEFVDVIPSVEILLFLFVIFESVTKMSVLRV